MNARQIGCALLLGACSLVAAGQGAPMPQLGTFSGPNRVPMPAGARAVDGEGMVWSAEQLKKQSTGAGEVRMGNFAWTPIYRVSLVQRPAVEPAHAPSEMHEDKTQIYFILSGTGIQVLGGKPDKDVAAPEGQHSADGPLKGGKTYRIGPGDMILIPPLTWHQTLADAGETITYQMVHIETRTRQP